MKPKRLPPPGFENVRASGGGPKPHRPGPSLPMTCRNCGVLGHLYKNCMHPIMSFGIICYRTTPTHDIEYLMIQRKDSLSFMEFIRGKYDLANYEYIGRLLSSMTLAEREYLLAWSFERLWNYVWCQATISRQTAEFFDSRTKFDKLREGYRIMLNGIETFLNLQILITVFPSSYLEPEWGFPKGRRRLHESDQECGIREFCEETGFKPGDITIVPGAPSLEEVFYGTNNVLYRHVYYLARFDGDLPDPAHIRIDPRNLQQVREVRAIRWFHVAHVFTNIRAHNQERRELFLRAHTLAQDFEHGKTLKGGNSNVVYTCPV